VRVETETACVVLVGFGDAALEYLSAGDAKTIGKTN